MIAEPALQPAAAYFLASYEDRAKVQAKINELPEDERDESWVDIANSDPSVQTYQRFPDLDSALAWLKVEIEAEKTFFGCGDVDEIMRLDRRDRCRCCDCNGYKRLRSWIYDGEGTEERSDAEHECCN